MNSSSKNEGARRVQDLSDSPRLRLIHRKHTGNPKIFGARKEYPGGDGYRREASSFSVVVMSIE
jgi:hypothetical protein